ncbi:MAG: phage tail assembly protein [Alphaproteobacteria bacterium]|nr:phage tail assembly protein [Alphaproteobacteria bacterium]
MSYQTVTVELERGLKDADDVSHKELVLREMIVKDLLSAGNVKDEEARAVHILANRVLRIGGIENPGLVLVEKLNLRDYEKIVEAANRLDAPAES